MNIWQDDSILLFSRNQETKKENEVRENTTGVFIPMNWWISRRIPPLTYWAEHQGGLVPTTMGTDTLCIGLSNLSPKCCPVSVGRAGASNIRFSGLWLKVWVRGGIVPTGDCVFVGGRIEREPPHAVILSDMTRCCCCRATARQEIDSPPPPASSSPWLLPPRQQFLTNLSLINYFSLFSSPQLHLHLPHLFLGHFSQALKITCHIFPIWNSNSLDTWSQNPPVKYPQTDGWLTLEERIR